MCTTDDEVCRLRNMFCKIKYVFTIKILTVLLLCRSFENHRISKIVHMKLDKQLFNFLKSLIFIK